MLKRRQAAVAAATYESPSTRRLRKIATALAVLAGIMQTLARYFLSLALVRLVTSLLQVAQPTAQLSGMARFYHIVTMQSYNFWTLFILLQVFVVCRAAVSALNRTLNTKLGLKVSRDWYQRLLGAVAISAHVGSKGKAGPSVVALEKALDGPLERVRSYIQDTQQTVIENKIVVLFTFLELFLIDIKVALFLLALFVIIILFAFCVRRFYAGRKSDDRTQAALEKELLELCAGIETLVYYGDFSVLMEKVRTVVKQWNQESRFEVAGEVGTEFIRRWLPGQLISIVLIYTFLQSSLAASLQRLTVLLLIEEATRSQASIVAARPAGDRAAESLAALRKLVSLEHLDQTEARLAAKALGIEDMFYVPAPAHASRGFFGCCARRRPSLDSSANGPYNLQTESTHKIISRSNIGLDADQWISTDGLQNTGVDANKDDGSNSSISIDITSSSSSSGAHREGSIDSEKSISLFWKKAASLTIEGLATAVTVPRGSTTSVDTGDVDAHQVARALADLETDFQGDVIVEMDSGTLTQRPTSWKRLISYVSNDAHVFSSSVYENITFQPYGSASADSKTAVAKIAKDLQLLAANSDDSNTELFLSQTPTPALFFPPASLSLARAMYSHRPVWVIEGTVLSTLSEAARNAVTRDDGAESDASARTVIIVGV